LTGWLAVDWLAFMLDVVRRMIGRASTPLKLKLNFLSMLIERLLLPLLHRKSIAVTFCCPPNRLLDWLQPVLNAEARLLCRDVLRWLPVPIEY